MEADLSGLSAEETLEVYCERYGHELGKVLYFLMNDWTELWITWHQFKNLFAADKERVDLLNKAAGAFFARVDTHFLNACISSICRLTDPVKSVRKPNLTVRMLPSLMTDDELRSEVTLLCNEALEKAESMRDHRNRRISHNDLAISLRERSDLEMITLEKMDAAIQAIFAPLNLISFKQAGAEISNQVMYSAPDEVSLLYRLFDAFEDEEHRRALAKENFNLAHREYPNWLSKR